jgi:photosystem II stability/assembly factor-like uncharacterized protein
MAQEFDAEIICLSANGKTISSSKDAPHKLLVATAEAVFEFHRADAKSDWVLVRNDIRQGHHVSALVYEPRSKLLFAGQHFEGGLLASADGGETWSPRNNGFKSEHIYTLMVQYRGDKTVLFAGTEPVMLYRSDDLGESWAAIPSVAQVRDMDQWFFPRSEPHIKNIASHPSEPDTIYVCVEQGDLLKTTDGGKTWSQADSLDAPDDKFRRDIHRVTFRKNDPKEIFLTTGIGLYHTTDGAKTWKHLTDPSFPLGYPDPFFIDPDDENVMYMVGAGGNPNPNWAKEGTAHPLVMKSTDSARTWVEAMNGMQKPVRGNIEAAAMHYSKECGIELFAGTACGELYYSRDGARSWRLVSNELAPVSKGPHFRHFLPQAERESYEDKLRAMNAFA